MHPDITQDKRMFCTVVRVLAAGLSEQQAVQFLTGRLAVRTNRGDWIRISSCTQESAFSMP
jgi:hypothetical protein